MPECYRLVLTEEFHEWLNNETPRSRYQIDARLAKIRLDGYFGNNKSVSHDEKGMLKDEIWELKFNDGRRIYYALDFAQFLNSSSERFFISLNEFLRKGKFIPFLQNSLRDILNLSGSFVQKLYKIEIVSMNFFRSCRI